MIYHLSGWFCQWTRHTSTEAAKTVDEKRVEQARLCPADQIRRIHTGQPLYMQAKLDSDHFTLLLLCHQLSPYVLVRKL